MLGPKRNNLKERKIILAQSFRGFESLSNGWIHCFGPEIRQNVMTECGHFMAVRKQREKARKGPGTKYPPMAYPQ
jgi:hypothetical protein